MLLKKSKNGTIQEINKMMLNSEKLIITDPRSSYEEFTELAKKLGYEVKIFKLNEKI